MRAVWGLLALAVVACAGAQHQPVDPWPNVPCGGRVPCTWTRRPALASPPTSTSLIVSAKSGTESPCVRAFPYSPCGGFVLGMRDADRFGGFSQPLVGHGLHAGAVGPPSRDGEIVAERNRPESCAETNRRRSCGIALHVEDYDRAFRVLGRRRTSGSRFRLVWARCLRFAFCLFAYPVEERLHLSVWVAEVWTRRVRVSVVEFPSHQVADGHRDSIRARLGGEQLSKPALRPYPLLARVLWQLVGRGLPPTVERWGLQLQLEPELASGLREPAVSGLADLVATCPLAHGVRRAPTLEHET